LPSYPLHLVNHPSRPESLSSKETPLQIQPQIDPPSPGPHAIPFAVQTTREERNIQTEARPKKPRLHPDVLEEVARLVDVHRPVKANHKGDQAEERGRSREGTKRRGDKEEMGRRGDSSKRRRGEEEIDLVRL
jgi:hypothetical protein